jgi:hypothetical protein
MRVVPLLALAGLGLLLATGSAVAAENTAPLADAGVDQTVQTNTTVYLNANGSVDPDGEIANVSWTVETPSGTTTAPACRDCQRTEFDANRSGRYNVTLTVTDEDGANQSDTLYVTVRNESGPTVSLSGPSTTPPGSDATFEATVTEDNAPLQSLAWLVDGEVVDRQQLDGSVANASLTYSFTERDALPVRAVVYDTLGNRGSAMQEVSVASSRNEDGQVCFDQICGNGSDYVFTGDGEHTIVDTNNQDGIQRSTNSPLQDYLNSMEKEKVTTEYSGEVPTDTEIVVNAYNEINKQDNAPEIDSSNFGPKITF